MAITVAALGAVAAGLLLGLQARTRRRRRADRSLSLRHGDRVFETYWTRGRGVEAMAPSYGLSDLTVYGRQEPWEDSPAGWPRKWEAGSNPFRTNGRPTAQWSRLESGRSDDLGTHTTGC